MNQQPIRLEALNPEHIKLAIAYELSRGYNRRLQYTGDESKYRVIIEAEIERNYTDYRTELFNITASSEDEAKKIAYRKADDHDWELFEEESVWDYRVRSIRRIIGNAYVVNVLAVIDHTEHEDKHKDFIVLAKSRNEAEILAIEQAGYYDWGLGLDCEITDFSINEIEELEEEKLW